MKTSIIMPTLNEEKYIADALKSLFNQTLVRKFPERFEFIVVDSNSTDRTVEIARGFGVRVLNSPPGILTARMIGIENSRGEIIASVNGDTYYPENYLELTLRHFQDPDVVAVSSPRLHEPPFTPLSVVANVFKSGPWLYGSNSLIRKDAFYKVGGFNLGIDQLNSKQLVFEEEQHLAEKLSKIGKYVFEWTAPVYTSGRRFFPDRKIKREMKEGIRFNGATTVYGQIKEILRI